MLTFREVTYAKPVPKGIHVFLVGDIGGTNTNFGFFKTNGDNHQLLVSIHFKSKEIVNFTQVVKQVLDYAQSAYGFMVKSACLACAGVVSITRDYSKPTNASFTIDAHDIKKSTGLVCVVLTNDFEIIGYGLSLIATKDLVSVNKGKPEQYTNKAIVGAGTGLGKCILFWESDRQMYVPIPSEGGHADFAPQTDLEFELVQFIKEQRNSTCNVSWEDVLSGAGITLLYSFFKHKNNAVKSHGSLETHGVLPDEIFKSRFLDEHSLHTFELYSKFYARCAKNFALDSLSRGGLYIAGGIAAKNLQLFEQAHFLQEFVNCGKQKELLKQIPVYVITDYNVSLFGAAEYMRVEQVCPLK